MTAVTPTFQQIKARVAAIPERARRGKAIGIHSLGRWSGEPLQHDGDQVYLICQCDSPLAMRLALREAAEDHATKVLITSLEDHELRDDVLLRLAKRQLFQIQPWQVVRSLFAAQTIDPRLTRHAWIAEVLLDLGPPEGYPAARGGFLDAETVWPLLLNRLVGLTVDTPDLTSLLKWSLDAEGVARFRRCLAECRDGVIAWLTAQAGPAAELVLRAIEQSERTEAVPVGLAAAVVFHPAAAGKLERSAGKLEERFLGGRSSDPLLLQRWSTAATEVVRALCHTDPRAGRQVLQRADEILSEVQADSFAYLSDTSMLGFDQRLVRVGLRLSDLLAQGAWELRDELHAACQAVRSHDQAAREPRRLERVEMAQRLARWMSDRLRRTPVEPQSFAEAAVEHLREGGFVDWARLTLRGEPVRELSAAYSQLFEQVTNVREQQSLVFARLLADWTRAGSRGDDVLPAERILEQGVAPLAAEAPVLVVVIDGMSVAVSRQLLADLTRHEWTALCESGRNFNRPGIAAIPSVTEFSRTSLLCGRLRQGAATDEKAGFAEHAALVAGCRSGFPPVLFHKAALQGDNDTALATDVRVEIASSQHRVVGVVVNAVDDHLSKGEQIDTHWSRDEIKVLPALLYEARIAGRVVVLLSDHGHVLDCQTQPRQCRDGDDAGGRWRTANGTPGDGELLIEGPRVMAPGQRLIAPWSERVRYGAKKNGYHGGLTPQEMASSAEFVGEFRLG